MASDEPAAAEVGGDEPQSPASHMAQGTRDAAETTINKTEGAPSFAQKVCFCLDRDNVVRRWCITVASHHVFNTSILLLILFNCVTMTLCQNPVMSKILSSDSAANFTNTVYATAVGPRWQWTLLDKGECADSNMPACSVCDWIDFSLLVIFTVEMTIKMIAMGICGNKTSYLQGPGSGWNWLDMIVVFAGITTTLFPNLPAIGNLRLCNVFLFLIFFLALFALFGVSFFAGMMRHSCHYYSDGEWVDSGETCDVGCEWSGDDNSLIGCTSLGNYTLGNASFATWRRSYSCQPGYECRCRGSGLPEAACTFQDNPNYGATHFDSIPWAVVSLFQAITLEGWVNQMYDLIDGCSVLVFIYFILLVLFGAIIIINLFLAVLCESFNMADATEEEDPKEPFDLPKAIAELSHTSRLRQRCLELARWKKFDWFIQACIIINTLLMFLTYRPSPTIGNPGGYPSTVRLMLGDAPGGGSDDQQAWLAYLAENRNWDYLPRGYWLALSIMNVLLTLIFSVESLVKVVGLGPRLFVKDRMNVFDFFVVIFSLVEIVFDWMQKFTASEFSFFLPLSVLRAFRIFRLFKLIRSIKSLRQILSTLVQSLASVFYLGLLLGLIVLIFILFGMEFFGGYYPRSELNYIEASFPEVWRRDAITWDDDWPSRYHFDDFGNALISIFVVLSGENWNEIMWDQHRATWDADVGSPLKIPFAIPYFILLFVVGNLILFNLFIAILLSNFEDEDELDDDDDEVEEEGGDAGRGRGGGGFPGIDLSDVGAVSAVSADVEGSVLEAEGPSAAAEPSAAEPPASAAGAASSSTAKSAGSSSAVGPEKSVGGGGAEKKRKGRLKKLETRMLTFEFGAFRDPTGENISIREERLAKRESLKAARSSTRASTSCRDSCAADRPSSSAASGGDDGDGHGGRAASPAGAACGGSPAPSPTCSSGGGGDGRGSPTLERSSSRAIDAPSMRSSRGSVVDDGEEKVPAFPISEAEMMGDRSLHIFSWSNPIRRWCAQVVMHRWFEGMIILLILLSTIALVIDMPHLPKTVDVKLVMRNFNYFFTTVFVIEMVLKIITSGLLFSKTPPKYTLTATPYLRDPWNLCLDLPIVLISLLALAELPGTQGIRALRAMRPLRLVSRYPDLKITVYTLFRAIPKMGSLMSVAFLFFTIFGILGLELFGGKMGYCMDPDFADEPYGSRVVPGLSPTGQNDYEECMALPRYNLTRRTTDGILLTEMAEMCANGSLGGGSCAHDWLEFVEFPQWLYPQFGTFDHIGYSLMLLFEVSALEGWPDVMHVAMDTDSDEMFVVPWPVGSNVGDGGGGVGVPMHHHVPSTAMAGGFFLLWIVIGCFVVVNLTIGVVVDTFTIIKKENDGILMMSEEAAEWVRTQKQVLTLRPLVQPRPPQARWRHRFYMLVISDRFEMLIMAAIMLNMFQMGLDWWEPLSNAPYQSSLKSTHAALNVVFFGVYVCEMIVKFVGLGFRQYFADPWNDFDFALVAVSLVDVVTTFLDVGDFPFPPSMIRMLRLVRVVRILRIIKSAKSMRTIMLTVLFSVPQLSNIMILILLIILIYALVCVNVFFAVNYTPGQFELSADKSAAWGRGEVYYRDDWHYSEDGWSNWGDSLNRHANFQFWWSGMLVLVRSATGEGFNAIMHDLFGHEWGHNRLTCCPQCGPMISEDTEELGLPGGAAPMVRSIPVSSCGDSIFAGIIYFTFQTIMGYIVLSIMIAIILENFSNLDSDDQKVSHEDIAAFQDVWKKYDPDGKMRTPSHNVLAILSQTPTPLGVAGQEPPVTRVQMLRILQELNLPDHQGYIHFNETLTHLAARRAATPVPDVAVVRELAKMSDRVHQRLEYASHNAYTNYVIALLQARFREHDSRTKDEQKASSALAAFGKPGGRGRGMAGLVAAAKASASPPAASAAAAATPAGGQSPPVVKALATEADDPRIPVRAYVRGTALPPQKESKL